MKIFLLYLSFKFFVPVAYIFYCRGTRGGLLRVERRVEEGAKGQNRDGEVVEAPSKAFFFVRG
jgi:hypothetical protein